MQKSIFRTIFKKCILVIFSVVAIVALQNTVYATDEKPRVTNVYFSDEYVVSPGVIYLTIEFEETGMGIQDYEWGIKHEKGSDVNWISGYTELGSNLIYTGEKIKIPVSIPSTATPGKYVLDNCGVKEYGDTWGSWEWWNFPEVSFEVKEEYNVKKYLTIGNPKLLEEIRGLQEGEAARIFITDGNQVAPKELFEIIRGKDITLLLYKNEYTWIFNGKDVVNECKDVLLNSQFSVQNGADYGADGMVAVLDFEDNGTLPGKAEFRINNKRIHDLFKTAKDTKLYYYHDGKYENEKTVFEYKCDQDTEYLTCFDLEHNSTFLLSDGEVGKEPPNAPKVKLDNGAVAQKIKLSWKKLDGAKKYDIYYATAKDGVYKKLTTTSKLTYTHSKATAGKEYYYKVRANGSNSATAGAFCNPVRAVKILSTPKLTCKTTKDIGQNVLKWKKIAGATSYELQCSVNGSDYETLYTTSKLTYTHKGLSGGNTYSYRLRAKSAVSDATSAYSTVKTVVIKCAKPTIKVKLDKTLKPVINWQKVPGAEKYQVYYASAKSGKYKLVGTVTDTSFTHSGAPVAKACYYKVVAVDKNGNLGSYSAVNSITTKCVAPAILKVTTNTKGKPVVSWNKTAGAKKYQVYVATTEGGKYKKLTTTSKLTYTYKKAKANIDYFFKITAYGTSTASKSAYSEVVKF